jgi:tripeptide aminopeptidase
MQKKVIERFIRYAGEHTTSDPESNTFPSSQGQVKFMKNLKKELDKAGLSEVELDNNGYLTATVPANGKPDAFVVGFIAHIDTSPDFPGKNIQPQIIDNYDGTTIILKNEIKIDPADFPEIMKYKGQSVITADGSTLLGADDKAGVAEIVTAAEKLLNSDNIKHGKIRIAFTPDEEIGKGMEKFDVDKFGADFAYTIDGGEEGELEYENFNAAFAKIIIRGRSVHPGTAKNKMINALLAANKIISLLPPDQRPEHTEKYKGFYHLLFLHGNVEKAIMHYLIRDHNFTKFEQKKKLLKESLKLVNLEYGHRLAEIEITDQYYNMRQKIEPVIHIVNIAKKAMKKAGVETKIKAIRGGTDGARLSYMGVPCPNIFTGGYNFHGPYEFIPVPSMLKAVDVIMNIAELAGNLNKYRK